MKDPYGYAIRVKKSGWVTRIYKTIPTAEAQARQGWGDYYRELAVLRDKEGWDWDRMLATAKKKSLKAALKVVEIVPVYLGEPVL